MLTNMDTWTAVRRALFVEKISQREACRRFQLNFRTIQKIVRTLPCQMEIPGMLEAYEKYHDSGLEIVSVYIWQSEHDPVATVKSYVEEKKLPWIIISEELSKKAGHPAYGDFYGMRSVPTMVLVDKEGKIIMTDARGVPLQAKLAEIFK